MFSLVLVSSVSVVSVTVSVCVVYPSCSFVLSFSLLDSALIGTAITGTIGSLVVFVVDAVLLLFFVSDAMRQ